MSHEPSLRFWLHYVEQEGGLVEDAGGHAVALLPPRVSVAAGLGEEVLVTSSPDIAREDGGLLLIAGHPELERAAAGVLDAGDVGRRFIGSPTAPRPRSSDLQAQAREQLDVAHGRIDANVEPRGVYLPVLRVGAMISYSASLTQRFQEQEESWIDGRTALPLPADLTRRLRSAPGQGAPDAPHSPLEPDLPRAVAAAHRQLEDRAAARRAALVTQARPLLERELAQVDAYYEAAVASIARRQAGAPEERHRLLNDQAAATRSEHARRRREIHDEFRARHEIRPFRMHLVLVPAFVLEVAVRRGPREYPFALTWMPISGSFAAVRCPHCDAVSELVAGRDRLGCRSCLTQAGTADAARPPRVADPPASPAPVAQDAGAALVKPPGGSAGAPVRPGPRVRSVQATRPLPSTRPPASRAARRAVGTARPTDVVPGGRDAGPKLALAFWQKVADGERWPKRKTARDSPLSALYRLYGAAGPLCALGVLPGRTPTEADALALPSFPDATDRTMGGIVAGGTRYAYVLGWMVEDGRPVLCELTPTLDPAGRFRRVQSGRSLPKAPDPIGALDPVASALWRCELPAVGLALTVRCLATWWRVEGLVEPQHRPEDLAAAVAGAVARAAAIRRTVAALSADYASQPTAARAVARELGPALRIDPGRGW